jgi:hypothetical protein
MMSALPPSLWGPEVSKGIPSLTAFATPCPHCYAMGPPNDAGFAAIIVGSRGFKKHSVTHSERNSRSLVSPIGISLAPSNEVSTNSEKSALGQPKFGRV